MEHSPFRDARKGMIHTAVGSYEKVYADSTTYLISFSMVQELCQDAEWHELKRAVFKFEGWSNKEDDCKRYNKMVSNVFTVLF